MDVLASDLQAKVTEYQHVIREQMAEIEKLRAECDGLAAENQRLLDWIMGDADAHTCLQAVYNDPTASQGNRIKAAAASLPFEKPKLGSVEPPVIRLNVISIPELLAQRQARADALARQRTLDLSPIPGPPNRNGSDS